MRRSPGFRMLLLAVCVAALGGPGGLTLRAGNTVTYRARISEADKRNSAGAPLRRFEQIIRQDRANFHRNGHRDPEDQGDPFFADTRARESLEGAAVVAPVDAATRNAILSGNPLVEITISAGADGSAHLGFAIIPDSVDLARAPMAPDVAQRNTVSYRARISEADKRNSAGEPLHRFEQIIRQDRANFHRNGHRDPEDQGDPYFADTRAREALEGVAAVAPVDAATRNAILSGNPLVEITISAGADGSAHLGFAILPDPADLARAPMVPDAAPLPEVRPEAPELAELYRRWIATPERIAENEEPFAELSPALFARSPGRFAVLPKKGLHANVGALSHDGRHALLETEPGMIELWNVENNLQVFSRRLLVGKILLITRAAEKGWMLCVARTSRLHRAIYKVPCFPGADPRLLWAVPNDFELFEPSRLLFVDDPFPGGADGTILFRAWAWNQHEQTTVIRLAPESHRFETISGAGDFERWLGATLGTGEGRRQMRAVRYGPEASQINSIPILGQLSPLREWARDAGLSMEVGDHLRPVSSEAGSFVVLDRVGTRELLLDAMPPYRDRTSKVAKVGDDDDDPTHYPAHVREQGDALPRRIGHRSPLVTIQDLSEDGVHALVRLSEPDFEVPKPRATRKSFRSHSLVLLTLPTLQATLLRKGPAEFVGAFEGDSTIVIGEIDTGKRSCRLERTDLKGTPRRAATLALGRFSPDPSTSLLRLVRNHEWILSFADEASCDSAITEIPMDRCLCHQGSSRHSFGFIWEQSGDPRASKETCRLIARADSGARIGQEVFKGRYGSATRLRFTDAAGATDHLIPPFAGDDGSEWGVGDGERLLVSLNESGDRCFVARNPLPFQGPVDAFAILGTAGSRVLLKQGGEEHTGNTVEDLGIDGLERGRRWKKEQLERYPHGPIAGDAFCWTGESSFFFATETSVLLLSTDGQPGWQAQPRIQGGMPNHATYDASRGWVVLSRDNALDFFSVKGPAPGHVASIFFDFEGRAFAFDSQSRFAGNTRAGASASLELDGEAYHFTQFDGLLNRPDVLLEIFGADPGLVATARDYRKRRNEKLGFSVEEGAAAAALPEVRIVGKAPLSVTASTVSLALEATDFSSSLDRIQVHSNGVPVFGKEGLRVGGENGAKWSGTVDVPLLQGQNDVRISVTNRSGLSSHEKTLSIASGANGESALYLAALGVSKYHDSSQDLELSAKDALDLTAHFKANSGGLWTRVETLCLTDFEVTRDSLTQVREFLAQAKPQDGAILFLAGHGLLDSNLEFRFATSEVDFTTERAGEGIRFADLEDALFDCASLRKLSLMDTCHAGEIDESRLQLLTSPRAGEWLAVKDQTRLEVPTPDFDRLVAGRNLIEHFFADLRRGSGATVLASSAGVEQSFEALPGMQNGVFTHFVLKCLREKAGDANRDGMIDLAELRSYVEAEVAGITNGHQKPSARSFNLVNPFVIAR